MTQSYLFLDYSPTFNADPKLYLQKINNNKLHLLIISGLYGLLKFDDLIPDYHFEMKKNPTWKQPLNNSILNAVKKYIKEKGN